MNVPEFQWTSQGREGMQKQGRSSQETAVQIWGRVLAQPQGIHITISSEFFIKPPINGSCQHSSFQRRLPKAQLKEPEKFIKRLLEDFRGGPVAKTLYSQCRGLGLTPGQGSHMPQLKRSHVLQQIWHSQILKTNKHIYFFLFFFNIT